MKMEEEEEEKQKGGGDEEVIDLTPRANIVAGEGLVTWCGARLVTGVSSLRQTPGRRGPVRHECVQRTASQSSAQRGESRDLHVKKAV